MQYAINLADLTQDSFLGNILIAEVTPSRQVVLAEKNRFDGGALLLECNERQALAIRDVIRLKFAKHELRFYESKTGIFWKRI